MDRTVRNSLSVNAFNLRSRTVDNTLNVGDELIATAELIKTQPAPADDRSRERERRGRRWLIWSFVFCPCHLPLSTAVLALIFGGTAFGSLISRNTLGVGIVFGVVYAIGVGIGFWHLRAAAGKNCSAGACET